MHRQQFYDLILLIRKSDVVPAAGNGMSLAINHQGLESQDALIFLRVDSLFSPQMSMDSGFQFREAKGLEQIIVPASSEPSNPVHFILASTQEHNGTLRPFPKLLADLNAVHLGHHHIEDDQGRLLLALD